MGVEAHAEEGIDGSGSGGYLGEEGGVWCHGWGVWFDGLMDWKIGSGARG